MSSNKIVDEWLQHPLTATRLSPSEQRSSFLNKDENASMINTRLSNERIWTLNEWLSHTRQWLEQHYRHFWLRGEVSNFTQAASGHAYFVLKDVQAQVRCVFFRMYAQRSALKLRNGLQIEVFAQATLYEERGDLQLRVEQVREVGIGDLWQRFLALKARLEGLGWFDAARKRLLPPHPRSIGIVTSPHAAALRDVVITLRRRAPGVAIILYPAPVQGEDAPIRLAHMIQTACKRHEVDILIVCRGGGSLEDLAAFNDERVAQAIFEASLPVISGVGHETDFTIADFVADVRAPTPTGAAVMAVPDERELHQRLLSLSQRLLSSMRHRLEREQLRIDHLSQQLRSPRERLYTHRQYLNHLLQRWELLRLRLFSAHQHGLAFKLQRFKTLQPIPTPELLQRRFDRLKNASFSYLQAAQLKVSRLEARYQAVHPLAPLERGYAMLTTSLPEEHLVTSIKGLAAEQPLQVLLRDGRLQVTITSITPASIDERIPGPHPTLGGQDFTPS